MRILFAASEMVPFCKTGGLADVIGALPPVLAERGHEVTVMLPGYSVIDRARYGFTPLDFRAMIPIGIAGMPLALSEAEYRGVRVLLLEHDCWRRDGLYGDESGDYPDNADRFIFYSRGVMEAAAGLGITPDIIHAHDWQAGLVPACHALIYRANPAFSQAATLMTIHNLGYQGIFPVTSYGHTGLPWTEFTWEKLEYWGNISFLKAGLVYADAISTVSETYAGEITHPVLGFGMDGVLRDRRTVLHGIVNGIDTDVWNPAADPDIPARYSADGMNGKKQCRAALLKAAGFDARPGDLLLGMVSRLDDQKGLDILERAADDIAASGVRLVVLGTGTVAHHDAMKDLMARHPGHIHVMLRFDNPMAHLIYAGADAFLMPSRYEPCGLSQLISMRYGTLPVVRATGGLTDTVRDLDSDRTGGNGFSFGDYTAEALADAVSRAVKAYREPGRRRWSAAVKRAMAGDYSWNAAAQKYETLYASL